MKPKSRNSTPRLKKTLNISFSFCANIAVVKSQEKIVEYNRVFGKMRAALDEYG